MNYARLAEVMPEDDKSKMLELYKTKYLAASQDALFLLWKKHTDADIKIRCSKCRLRLINAISKYLTIVRAES